MTSSVLREIRCDVLGYCTPMQQHSEPQGSTVFRLYSPLNRWDGALKANGNSVYVGGVKPGMLRLGAPSEREVKDTDRPARALVISIPELRLQEMFAGLEIKRSLESWAFRPILHPNRQVSQLVRAILSTSRMSPDARALMLSGLTEALVGLLLDHHVGSVGSKSHKRILPLSDERMMLSESYAEAHRSSSISIQEWAEHVGLGASDFTKQFTRKTGETPYSWFLNRRIERAQKELSATDFPLGELSLELGFSSQSHFTEAFRKRTGLSPARWRALQKHRSRD